MISKFVRWFPSLLLFGWCLEILWRRWAFHQLPGQVSAWAVYALLIVDIYLLASGPAPRRLRDLRGRRRPKRVEV